MAGLFERMGLVRTEYEGMPEIPMQPVSEPMYAPETPVIDATQVSYDDVIASISVSYTHLTLPTNSLV